MNRRHASRPEILTLIRDVAFVEIASAVLVVEKGRRNPGLLDFVDCSRDDRSIRPGDVRIRILKTTARFQARFQKDQKASMINESGDVQEIPPFCSRA